MTLEEYRKAKHEDFFLAVIVRKVQWEEADKVTIYLPEYPNGITIADALKNSVKQALKENNESLTEEKKKQIEEEVKDTISTCVEEEIQDILLKQGDSYICMSLMEGLGPEYEIKCLVPLKEYYNENDYSFEEDEDGPYFNIDLKPFHNFVDDYEEGLLS